MSSDNPSDIIPQFLQRRTSPTHPEQSSQLQERIGEKVEVNLEAKTYFEHVASMEFEDRIPEYQTNSVWTPECIDENWETFITIRRPSGALLINDVFCHCRYLIEELTPTRWESMIQISHKEWTLLDAIASTWDSFSPDLLGQILDYQWDHTLFVTNLCNSRALMTTQDRESIVHILEEKKIPYPRRRIFSFHLEEEQDFMNMFSKEFGLFWLNMQRGAGRFRAYRFTSSDHLCITICTRKTDYLAANLTIRFFKKITKPEDILENIEFKIRDYKNPTKWIHYDSESLQKRFALS